MICKAPVQETEFPLSASSGGLVQLCRSQSILESVTIPQTSARLLYVPFKDTVLLQTIRDYQGCVIDV